MSKELATAKRRTQMKTLGFADARVQVLHVRKMSIVVPTFATMEFVPTADGMVPFVDPLAVQTLSQIAPPVVNAFL